MSMTEWEAIEKRISCRAFTDRPVDPAVLEELRAYVDELNGEAGLHFQLYSSDRPGKPAIKMAASMFSGPVYAFAALVAGDDPASLEKLGYYGEKFVLKAVGLGLGTCWVASTYDAGSISVDVGEGERLWDVVPLGYAPEKMPLRQTMTRAMIRKRDRKEEAFLDSASDTEYGVLPEWVRKGILAVLKGPSAINQQPVNILYRDGTASMVVWKHGQGLEFNDMGIAKRQFEIGAAEAGVPGRFEWGDGGRFVPEQ